MVGNNVINGDWNRPLRVPEPVVAPENEGMWRAAAEGRLDVQRCASCSAHRYPPAASCPRCSSVDWTWSTLPGTGTIYSYTWVPDRQRSAEQGREICYNVAVVELDGTAEHPVRMTSNVLDAWEPEDLAAGQAVTLVPVPVGDGVALPCFRRVR